MDDPKKKKAVQVDSWDEEVTTKQPRKAIEVSDWDEEVSVAEPPKKKVEPAPSFTSGTGFNFSKPLDLGVQSTEAKAAQKPIDKLLTELPSTIDENDPVGSALQTIGGYMPMQKVIRPATSERSASQYLSPEAQQVKTSNEREVRAEELTTEKKEKISLDEGRKLIGEVENSFKNSTENSIKHLVKKTGLSREQLYSDDAESVFEANLDGNNQTDRLAFNRLQDAKKAKSAIDNSGGRLTEAAFNLAAADNPTLKTAKGEAAADLVLNDKTLGSLMYDAVNNSAFAEEVQKNPQLASQFRDEKINLIDKHPEFGKKLIGSAISQELEDMGINNALINSTTKEEFDKAVQSLKSKGVFTDREVEFANKNIRGIDTGIGGFFKGLVNESNIKTTGLVESAVGGLAKGYGDIAKGVYEATVRKPLVGEQRIAQTDVDKGIDFQVKPKGIIHEIANTGGAIAGQSFSIGQGGGMLQSMKLAKNPKTALGVVGATQAYANYIPQARELFPDSELKQRAFASILSGLEWKTEGIFNDMKVVNALTKKMKPEVSKVINDFTAKKITAEAARESLQGALVKVAKDIPQAAKYFIKGTGQNVAEEDLMEIGSQTAEGVFTGKKFSDWYDGKKLWETTRTAMLGSAPIAAISTYADLKNARGVTAKSIYDMAQNKDYWVGQIMEDAKLDEDLAVEAQDKIDNLEYAAKLVNEMPQEWTDKKKAKYLITELDNKVRGQNMSQKSDPLLKQAEDLENVQAIHGNNKVKEDIINGTDDGTIEGDNSDDLTPQETEIQQELKEKALPGIGMDNLDMVKSQSITAPIVMEEKLGKPLFDKVISTTTNEQIQEAIDSKEGNDVEKPAADKLKEILNERKFATPETNQATSKAEPQAPDVVGKGDEKVTAKALEDVGNVNSGLIDKAFVKLTQEQRKLGDLTKEQKISEEYVKAKADGSNPALVAAVDNILKEHEGGVYNMPEFEQLRKQVKESKDIDEFTRNIITDFDVRYKNRKAAQPLVKTEKISEIDKIKPYQKVDKSTVKLWEESIKEGESPFVIIRDNGIDGQHKLQAYKNLGYEYVPVLYEKDLKDFYNKISTSDEKGAVKESSSTAAPANTLKPSTPSQTKVVEGMEGQGSGGVGYEDFRKEAMGFAMDVKKEKRGFDWVIGISNMTQAEVEGAIKDIENGKQTKRRENFEKQVKEMHDKGVMTVSRGTGANVQWMDIPIKDWMAEPLDAKELEASTKITPELAAEIEQNGITLNNIDNFKHLFDGFPYDQSDFQSVKDFLAADKSNASDKIIGEKSQEKIIDETNQPAVEGNKPKSTEKESGSNQVPPEPPQAAEGEVAEPEGNDLSGIKKALVSDEIIKGVDMERVGDDEMMAMGRKIIDSGEVKPRELVEKIITEKAGVLTPAEVVALIYYKTDLDNKQRETYTEINKRKAAGEDLGTLGVEAKNIEREISDYEVMSVITAQQQSLAFRLRQKLLDQDYNIVTQIEKYKANNNGYIPPEVEAKFNKIDKKLKDVRQRLFDSQNMRELKEAQDAVQNIKEYLARQDKLSQDAPKENTFKGKAKKAADTFRKLKTKPFKFKDENGVEYDVTKMGFSWNDLVELGARAIEKTGEIADGIKAVFDRIQGAEWYKKLSDKDKKRVFTELEDYYKEQAEDSPEGNRIKQLEKQLEDLQQGIVRSKNEPIDSPRIQELKEEIYEAKKNLGLIKGKPLSEEPTIKLNDDGSLSVPPKVIEILVAKGVTDINDLVDNIYEEAVSVKPDVTKREVRDIITNYGKKVNQTAYKIQQQANTAKRIGRLLSELEDLQNKKSKTTNNDSKAKLTTKERELKRQIRVLQKEAGVEGRKLTEEEKLSTAKERVKNRIADLERRIKNKDFAKKTKLPEGKDDELVALEAEKEKLQNQFDEEQYKLTLKQRNWWQKREDELLELTSGVVRGLVASFDLSAVFVQGLKRLFIDIGKSFFQAVTLRKIKPNRSIQAFGAMFKSLVSKEYSETYLNKVKSSEAYPLMQASKLAIDDKSGHVSAKEGLFISNWINLIWNHVAAPIIALPVSVGTLGNVRKAYNISKAINPYAASQRAFDGYVNSVRVNTFLDFAESLKNDGYTFESDEKVYKKMADVINTQTGRGSLGAADASSKWLNIFLFAPRKVISEVKLYTPYAFAYYAKLPAPVRKRALVDLGVFLTTFIGANALLRAGLKTDDDDDEDFWNPNSSSFLTHKIGDKKISIGGGAKSMITFQSRFWTGTFVDQYGNESKLGDRYGKQINTRFDLLTNFIAGKASPAFNVAIKKAQERKGLEIDKGDMIKDLTVPIFMQDLKDIYKDDPATVNSILTAFSLFGANLRTVEDSKKRSPFTDEDKKDPVFKYWLDKDMQLPNVVPASVDVPDKETKSMKNLTDYPEEKIKEYQDLHKKILKEELKEVKDRGYVYIDDYGSMSTAAKKPKGYDKVDIDDLDKLQLAKILKSAQGSATDKTKEKLFPKK